MLVPQVLREVVDLVDVDVDPYGVLCNVVRVLRVPLQSFSVARGTPAAKNNHLHNTTAVSAPSGADINRPSLHGSTGPSAR